MMNAETAIAMIPVILFNLILSFWLPGPDALTRYSYTEYHMGVDARLVVYAPDIRKAEEACTAAFKRIAELDSIMSDYRRDSELNRLCEKSGGPAVKVSADLYRVLRKAEEVSRRSEGAFDITVGPLIALWRNARKTGKLPTPGEIDTALKLVSWQHIHLESGNKVRLALKGMK